VKVVWIVDATYRDGSVDQFEEGRSESWRRSMWIAGIAALVVVVGLIAYLLVARAGPETAVAVRRDITQWESLRGTIVAPPNEHAVINCHCDAPVTRVFASVGQTVRRGDVIAELAHPTAQAAYDVARQELANARSAYEQARQQHLAAVRQAQQRLANARRDVELAEAAASPEVEVPASIETPVGPAMPEPPAQDPAGQPVAPPLAQAEAEMDQARAQLGDAQVAMGEELTPRLQRLRAAEQGFQEAQQGVKNSFIRAPIGGQVIELNVSPGRQVNDVPNQIVAEIANLSALKLHARMVTRQADVIDTGMEAQLQVDALPEETLSGQVQEVQTRLGDPATDEGNQLQRIAVISFANTQGLAKPNMQARVLVKVDEAEDVVSVPVSAIYYDDDDQPTVRVRQQGEWVSRAVELGPSDGEQVAVLSGLQEGERVRLRS
jgi:multidrug efflux pump subunit AcrA (membrane-fusion protein)